MKITLELEVTLELELSFIHVLLWLLPAMLKTVIEANLRDNLNPHYVNENEYLFKLDIDEVTNSAIGCISVSAKIFILAWQK